MFREFNEDFSVIDPDTTVRSTRRQKGERIIHSPPQGFLNNSVGKHNLKGTVNLPSFVNPTRVSTLLALTARLRLSSWAAITLTSFSFWIRINPREASV